MKMRFTNACQQTPNFPDDLRSVVGERRLVELALEAAQIVGEALPRPERIVEDQPGPRMLLTLLTFCYAAGIYGSQEIQWASESDAAARYICANTLPDQDTIRRFRRANRPWIEACLVWVYGNVCLADRTRTDIACFVRQKLELAIMMDTATADS